MAGSFSKGQLGINLSSDAISIVESSDREIKRHFRQSLSSFGAGLNELLEDEIKFAAVLQKILRENEFISRQAAVSLPAEDVIIRFFDIPLVSQREINSTVNFEARKYIPFRIEELIFDFLAKRRRGSKRFDVIFVAIKKKSVDRYTKVLNQVGFEITSLEPAVLSFLRAVKALAKINMHRTVLILNVDAQSWQGDIGILDSGIPSFLRDIKLFSTLETRVSTDSEIVLTKLINEIRISIDYFRHRQVSAKTDICEIFLFSDVKDLNSWVDLISQELGIKCSGRTPADLLGIALGHCDFIKAFGASLRGGISFPVDLTLLKGKEEAKEKESHLVESTKSFISKPVFKKCAISIIIILALSILLSFLGNLRIKNLRQELKALELSREKLSFLSRDLDLKEDELSQIREKFKQQLRTIEKTVDERFYLSEKIARLPAILPEGMWLSNLSFRNYSGGLELTLNGVLYLPQSGNALKVINQFLAHLREDKLFFRGFNDIILGSVEQSMMDEVVVRTFQVKCR